MDTSGVRHAAHAADPSVLAVLVAREGERWLPRVLGSLNGLTHRPDRWIAVDVGSHDKTAELLTEAFGANAVIGVKANTGFGDSIRAALKAAPATDWIWLLHDDAIVDSNALRALLDEAAADPFTAVVGPKIREWPSLRRLLEVGVSISSTGNRETGLEPGEPDHGQHDWSETVLAVSTAGMLVRRDVWDELGGLDPELPLFYDDVDFGWRVSRAGYTVRCAPDAVLFHVEASRRGMRNREAHSGERRASAVYTILANETGRRFWWQSLRLFLGTLVRMLGSAIVRDGTGVRAEIAALGSVYLRPARMKAARERRAEHVRLSRRELNPLFPSPAQPYQHGLEVLTNTWRALVKPEEVETIGHRTSGVGDIDEEELPDLPPLWRRYPWLVVTMLLSLAALIAARGLFGGPLSGPALPQSPDTAGTWWGLVFGRFHDVGLGSTQWASAYVVPLALTSTLLWWIPGLVVWSLFVFAVPFAALTAHRFGRLISSRRLSRKVWAISWGLAIFASGAITEGRLGTVVALIVAPIVLNAALRLLVMPGWQLTFMFAIWTAVLVSFAPATLLLVLVGTALAGLQMGWQMVSRHWVAIGIAAVLTAPSLVRVVLHPSRWWWEAGRPVPSHATALELVSGQGGASGMPPWWLALPLVVLALFALFPGPTRAGVIYTWVIGLTGLAMAVLGQLFSDAWVGLGAGVWLISMATAVLLAVPSVKDLGPRLRRVLLVTALIFPIAVGTWWVIEGIADPLQIDAPPDVPLYLAADGMNTAVLDGSSDTGFVVSVHTGFGPLLGEEQLSADPATADAFVLNMQTLMTSPSDSSVRAIADAGVDAIYLPGGDEQVAAALDSAPELSAAGSDRPGARVWLLPVALKPAPDEHPQASFVRPFLAGAWVAAWLGVTVFATPVRLREDEG